MTRKLELHPDRLLPADPTTRGIARTLMPKSRTCRSSARTAIPIRAGSPPTNPGRTPATCCSRPTIMSSACSIARASRSMIWASRIAAAAPRPIRAWRGSCSRPTITCSAARRRACGSTMSLPRCSASTWRWKRRPPTVISTRSARHSPPPPFAPARAVRAVPHRMPGDDRRRRRSAGPSPGDPGLGLAGSRHHHLSPRQRDRCRA